MCFRPLNVIGMPYYNDFLLSSWVPDFIPHGLHYPPLAKIPQQILNTMKINDNVAYAALPKELRGRRNVAVTAPKKPEGRFRSGKRQTVCSKHRKCYDELTVIFLADGAGNAHI